MADDDGVVVVQVADVPQVAQLALARMEKEENTRQVLATGKLGLDHYGMRERLEAKGLRYVNSLDEL